MYTNRLLTLFISIALLAVAVLLVREANATGAVVATMDSANRSYTARARSLQGAAVPVTGISELPDYYQRHPELRVPLKRTVDTADYFVRHPELHTPAESIDLSDYFLRH